MDSDTSAQFVAWGQSTERSPLTSSLTEDDFLEMVSFVKTDHLGKILLQYFILVKMI